MTAPQTGDPMRDTRTSPAATPTSPRVLKTADEAPCGSLVRVQDVKPLRLRLWNGNGWTLDSTGPLSWAGWTWQGGGFRGPVELIAEGLTEAECRHLSGLSAADAIAWCEKRAALLAPIEAEREQWGLAPHEQSKARASVSEAMLKPRPQPGDVVPWAEVEDGAVYDAEGLFRCIYGEHTALLDGVEDKDLAGLFDGSLGHCLRSGLSKFHWDEKAILVARDLGSDPEAWRRAMREWTANGNKPSKAPAEVASVSASASIASAPAAGAPDERRGVKRIVDPLRQPGLLSMRGLPEATPERVVELTVERIEADRREIERLRAANVEARRALETPGRQGLRARLAKAEAALAALPKTPSWARVKIASTFARDTRVQADRVPGLEAELARVSKDHARSVDALTAQRDEARRALAEEKIKTTRLGGDITSADAFPGAGRWEQLARLAGVADLGRAAAATGPGSGLAGAHARKTIVDTLESEVGRLREVEGYHERLEIPTVEATLKGALGTVGHITTMTRMVCKDLAGQKAEVVRLRDLLTAATAVGDAAALVKPLRLAMGWGEQNDLSAAGVVASAATALQWHRAEVPRLQDVCSARFDKITILRSDLDRETERRRAAEAGAGQAMMLLNAWQRWARPLWPEGPPNPADAALRDVIGARVTRGIPLPNEEALSALRKVLPANLHDDPSEGRTPSDMVHGAAGRLLHLEQWGRSMTVALQAATDRAEKAERNLRAAAELLAA